MRKLLVGSLILFFGSLSISATAGETGPYIGISAGSAWISDDEALENYSDYEDSGTALKLAVGGRVNDYFAIEGSLNGAAGFELGPVDMTVSSFDIGILVGSWLTERFRIDGKVGVAFWKASYEADTYYYGSFEEEESGHDLVYGIEGLVMLSDHFGLTAAYETIPTDGVDLSAVLVGGKYQF